MNLDFNDKGKYFTDVISKAAVPAIIQTTMHRIEGYVHIRLDGRLKDELDRNEAFLPVTNVKVFNTDGSILYEAEFLSIARQQIVWVMPNGESVNPGEIK